MAGRSLLVRLRCALLRPTIVPERIAVPLRAWIDRSARSLTSEFPQARPTDERAQLQFVDVVMTFFLVVAIMGIAPVLFTFTGMVSGQADPFSSLLLELALPIIIIALLISVGVSARSGGG